MSAHLAGAALFPAAQSVNNILFHHTRSSHRTSASRHDHPYITLPIIVPISLVRIALVTLSISQRPFAHPHCVPTVDGGGKACDGLEMPRPREGLRRSGVSTMAKRAVRRRRCAAQLRYGATQLQAHRKPRVAA